MPPVQRCSECGQRLPDGASEWLCPVCALRSVADGGGGLLPQVTSEGGLPLPHSFGDYELIEEIARGGMGVVYKARQKGLNRFVALKMVLGGTFATPAARQRFLAEAQMAASLQHPNIVAIHEVGEHAGQPFFSMDYVEGRNLAELLREGPVLPSRAAAYVKTVAETVAYAHQHGISHRDLKPSNVLIDRSDRPRITDFGLAKQMTGESDLTVSGQVLGSPNFMAPEQAQGRPREVGPASDVYSIGALLYHLLTGRPPFQAATLTEVLRQVVTTEPPPPRLLNAGIPRDLETICLKCLEKDIPRRYPTAQALADEVGRFMRGEPILARPVGHLAKAGKWCQRNPRVAAAIGVAALSLLVGLVGVTWQWRRAGVQRTRAEAEALTARRNAYAADMKEVQRALEDSDLGRARELLNSHRPRAKAESGKSLRTASKAEIDLRGWEWRYLWSRCQSEERFTLCRYSNAVSALAFSPDGKWLAVRREGGAVVLWNMVAKQPQAELAAEGRSWCNKALAFSPRQNLLAWGSVDATGGPVISLRDVEGQREIALLACSTTVRSVAFSPDAKAIAALGDDGTVRVWDIDSEQIVTNLPPAKVGANLDRLSIGTDARRGSRGDRTKGSLALAAQSAETRFPTVNVWSDHYGCVVFSPDGRWLAVGQTNALMRLLDRTTGEEKEPILLAEPADGISALAFSPDSRLLAAGCGVFDQEITVRDMVDGTQARLAGHSGWVTAVAFSPDGRTLASAGADQTIRLWDVKRKTEQRRFQGNTDEIWALAWSPNGQDLVTGAKDGSVRYWDPGATSVAPYAMLSEPIRFWGPVFLPDSKSLLAVTGREGAVVRWDMATGQPVERLAFLGTNHTSMNLSPDGRWLALGDAVGNIRVWDFPARRAATNLALPTGEVDIVFFSPRGGLLCGAQLTKGPRGKIWTAAGWHELDLRGIQLDGGLQAVISPDDRIFAGSYVDGRVIWWDLASRERRAVIDCHCAGGVFVAFSAEGKRFATGGMDGELVVWDSATRQPRPMGRGYRNGVQALVFSPDGRRLVTSGTNPRALIKLWDVETGREVTTLAGESGWFCRIGFSPDGNTLFAASSEGTALLWHAPSFAEIVQRESRRDAAR